MKLSAVRDVAKRTLHDFSEHKIVQLSAALAYNALFAIAPFLLIVAGVAGLFMGEENVRRHLHEQLSGMLGSESSDLIDSMMAARREGTSLLATILGAVALILGATGLFGQLQNALNTIWSVKPKPGRGFKETLRDRFLSLAMVFGICFLLLISMILSTVLAASSGAVGNALSLPEWVAHIVDLLFSVGMLTLLFAAMFKYLPDAKIPWRNVWGGAIATAILFTIGKWGLAMYLGRESTTSAYGAAGSLVIIIMWVYYASVIIFLGAELTQVVTRHYSHVQVQPTENAVAIDTPPEEEQAVEKPEVGERELVERKGDKKKPLGIVTALFAIVALFRWMRS